MKIVQNCGKKRVKWAIISFINICVYYICPISVRSLYNYTESFFQSFSVNSHFTPSTSSYSRPLRNFQMQEVIVPLFLIIIYCYLYSLYGLCHVSEVEKNPVDKNSFWTILVLPRSVLHFNSMFISSSVYDESLITERVWLIFVSWCSRNNNYNIFVLENRFHLIFISIVLYISSWHILQISLISLLLWNGL